MRGWKGSLCSGNTRQPARRDLQVATAAKCWPLGRWTHMGGPGLSGSTKAEVTGSSRHLPPLPGLQGHCPALPGAPPWTTHFAPPLPVFDRTTPALCTARSLHLPSRAGWGMGVPSRQLRESGGLGCRPDRRGFWGGGVVQASPRPEGARPRCPQRVRAAPLAGDWALSPPWPGARAHGCHTER